MGFRIFQIYAFFLFFVLAAALPAESEESVSKEINHLLQYIESSGCIFIRNGKEYNSVKARAHIQKKYDYINGRINKTEDFIKYAATRSSMSGKLYKVRCNGRELGNADWLNTELQKLRTR